nr:respiratory burst oxidase homolog protein B [Ipomoea batatas]
MHHNTLYNLAELRDFWQQITDTSFDARLQTFFDICDKDADGRITEAKRSKSCTIWRTLLLQASEPLNKPCHKHRVLSQATEPETEANQRAQPLVRCYKKLKYFIEDNWKRIWRDGPCGYQSGAGLFTWKFIQYKHKSRFDIMGYVSACKRRSRNH